VPGVDDVKKVIASMPATTDIEKRDRAVIAFTLLTGARVGAAISAKLRHVDLAERQFFQDGREVRTKRAKTFPTWFFPVGDDLEAILSDWIGLLQRRGFNGEHPLFPATRLAHDEGRRFVVDGLSGLHWRADQPVRDIFRSAFSAAGLPPPNPHIIRDTLVHLGMQICSIEEFKAWSQNLGHDEVHTTLSSYGTLDPHRQRELMRQVGQTRVTAMEGDPDAATVGWVVGHLVKKAS
jgi:integrase